MWYEQIRKAGSKWARSEGWKSWEIGHLVSEKSAQIEQPRQWGLTPSLSPRRELELKGIEHHAVDILAA